MVSENEVNSDDTMSQKHLFKSLQTLPGFLVAGLSGFRGPMGKCLNVSYLFYCIYFNIFRKMQLITSAISQIFLTQFLTKLTYLRQKGAPLKKNIKEIRRQAGLGYGQCSDESLGIPQRYSGSR